MIDASSRKDERRWVERIRDGDERAFEQLFHTYYARLCAFATEYVDSADAARDVVQDVFLDLWLCRQDWILHTSLRAYLYQAVRNQSLDQRRGEERRAKREQAVKAVQAPLPAAEEAYHRKELAAAIWEAIDRLPERRREAFVLHRWHDHTYKEVAEIMGIRPKTVENQIGRALKFLRETLPPEYF